MKPLILILLVCMVAAAAIGVYVFPKKTPTDPALRAIQSKGKLTIGTDAPYGIMEFLNSEGKVVGIDADIGTEIGKRLGVTTEVIDFDFDELLDAVKTGEVDIAISSITITSEREKEMLFSIPYFNGGQSILVRNDSTNIVFPDDLKNKKIAVQKESTGETEAKKYTALKNIKVFDSYEATKDAKSGIVYELITGVLDAAILDYIACVSIVKDNPELKIAGDPITQEYYGIVTKLDNTALIETVNSVLRDLKNSGRFQEIVNKWK